MRRKHKKFIDPRYFMNEKTGMPQYDDEYDEQDAPYDTEAEAQLQQDEPQKYAGDLETVAAASDEIERILNQLYDSGVQNDGLKALLQNIIKDIDSGFVGEPT